VISQVDVVLPCRDEATALPSVLLALPPGFVPLVVDNGSTDGTAEVARRHGVRVVPEPRLGYGAAVHTGLEHAETELVAVLDADGSLDPAVLPVLAALVTEEGADLAVGRRRPVSAAAQPWHARAGTAVLASLLRGRGVPVHDIAPIRVARRARLLDLGVTDRGFGYPLELLLRAAAVGWQVREIDVRCFAHPGGRSKITGSVRGTARAIRELARVGRT
jgi:glycosyltransferase involved in cell wall biosynthesis